MGVSTIVSLVTTLRKCKPNKIIRDIIIILIKIFLLEKFILFKYCIINFGFYFSLILCDLSCNVNKKYNPYL